MLAEEHHEQVLLQGPSPGNTGTGPAVSVEEASAGDKHDDNVHSSQAHEAHSPSDAIVPSPLKQTKTEMDLLHMQGAFNIPNSTVCLELFKVYFNHVSPHYPVIDRETIFFEYAIPQRPPSWLLLQAILFVAAGHCDESLLIQAGFSSRYDARLTLFKRTKALYDSDHEKDKFTIVQAVFLMSFWWASPIDSKDPWHWLGVAISLALTIGLNRSTKESSLPLKTRRLRKRLWWSLYTEDKHVATAFGRPVRIPLSDCKVEPLEMTDFEGEFLGFGDTLITNLPKVIMAYPICLTNLSKIAELIVEKSQQASKPHDNFPSLCDGMIEVWEGGLMELLRFNHVDIGDTIWPCMIHIAAWQVPNHSTIAEPAFVLD